MAKAKDVQIKLDLETRDAQRNLKKLAQETQSLDDDLEDTKSAGEAMADAIAASAQEMEEEIDATKKAVDALDRAMESADLDLDVDSKNAVADLKKLGLTAEDIENDAEALAKSLKRIDDVNVKAATAGFDSLDQAVGNTSDGVGKADDVTRSFVGNSISELPGVGEAFGPAGEAISQMTEGLMAGEIGMTDLVKAGSGMVAVGGAVMVATKAWEAYQKRQEKIKKQQAEILEGAQEALDVAQDGKDLIEKMEGLTPLTDLIVGRMDEDQFGNVSKALTELGLGWEDLAGVQKTSVDQITNMTDLLMSKHTDLNREQATALAEYVAGNERASSAVNFLALSNEAFSSTSQDAMDSIQDTVNALEELDDSSDSLDLEEEVAKALAQVALEGGRAATALQTIRAANPDASETEIYALLVAETEAWAAATEAAEEAQEDLNDAMQNAVDVASEQYEITKDLIGAERDRLGLARDLEEAEWDLADAGNEYNEVLASSDSSLRDAAESSNKLEESLEGVGAAAVSAAGATATHEEKERARNAAMFSSIATMQGPAKEAALQYILDLNGIPEDKQTLIKALVAEGKLKEAEDLLNTLSTPVITSVKADVDQAALWHAENQLNWLGRARGAAFNPYISDAGTSSPIANEMWPQRARGGPVDGRTTYLVGEEGPELITPTRSGFVHTADETNAMLGAPRSASGVTNVTVNMPSGSKPTDVMHAIRRYERIQGVPQ